MAKSKMSKSTIISLVEAIVLLVIGVLFCFSSLWGMEAMSIILGVAFIAVGVVFVLLSLIGQKSLLKGNSIAGFIAIAFGIVFIVNNGASWLFALVPYVLIVAGAAVLVDGILGKCWRKTENLVTMILKIVVGAVAITLGILLLTVSEFANFVGTLFGILVTLFAILFIVQICMDLSKKNK